MIMLKLPPLAERTTYTKQTNAVGGAAYFVPSISGAATLKGIQPC